jgi:hypothetical protein
VTIADALAEALPQIITGSATLVAGLGAASLTLWMTGKRQESERGDARDRDRRREQRIAIVEVIDAGHAWVKSQDGVILVVAVVPDTVELASTETVNNHGPIAARYHKALVTARLTVVDEELSPIIRALSDSVHRAGELLASVVESTRQRRRAEPEPVGRASGSVRAHQDALQVLESKALQRLAP